MKAIEYIASIEGKLRPFTTLFSPELISKIYSSARSIIIHAISNEAIEKRELHKSEKIRLWDIDFNCALFNAAGMFKNGEGYNVCANMGAGAYLAGTTTSIPRDGNKRNGVNHPFIYYPHSKAASNWMGLPNKGHAEVAKKLSRIEKIKNCPVGASIAADPQLKQIEQLNGICSGFMLYDKAKVDFIELNESCPNVAHAPAENMQYELATRLEYIYDKCLRNRTRNLPVIVKFSNDTNMEQIPQLIDILVDYGFDGINFGNTSTNYKKYINQIDALDRRFFQYFTQTFGGGLSGEILRNNSLELCKIAVNHIKSKALSKEFHCIRTGGIMEKNDIAESKNNGILLNEWFSGFFDNFAKYGFDIYENFMKKKFIILCDIPYILNKRYNYS